MKRPMVFMTALVMLLAFIVAARSLAGSPGGMDTLYAANNPCSAKNPCSMKHPCSMKNPCAMRSIPIRKDVLTDMKSVLESGERLWYDTGLGASGLSCGTCHPEGKGLKGEPYPRYINMGGDILTLDQMINFCMTNPMKGKPLAWNSHEITALGAYIKARISEADTAAPSSGNPCSAKNPCSLRNPCSVKNP